VGPFPLALDPRTGSGDLLRGLELLKVPVVTEILDFGDARIIGRGPGERPVLVGVEIKKLSDLLQCIKDERFTGHQLPGLRAAYEVPVLLVESGMTAAGSRQLLAWNGRNLAEVPSRWTFEAVEHFLFSMTYRAGLIVDHTLDRRGTAAWLAAQWSWWTDKAYDEHRSHLGLHAQVRIPADADTLDLALMGRRERRRMLVARALADGVGYEKARALAEGFRSVRAMVNADARELETVEGIGRKLAARIVDEAAGED